MYTIFAGSAPIKNLGRRQYNLLDFALRFPGWHTYRGVVAKRAVKSLEKRGVIEHSESTQQFRFKQI